MTITRDRVAQFIKNPLDNGLTRGEQMELARIALASLEADGWVACSERMPEKREMDIWLFNGEGVYHGYVWDGFGFTDWNEEYNPLPGVTHWMPMTLPAAPQQESE